MYTEKQFQESVYDLLQPVKKLFAETLVDWIIKNDLRLSELTDTHKNVIGEMCIEKLLNFGVKEPKFVVLQDKKVEWSFKLPKEFYNQQVDTGYTKDMDTSVLCILQ